MTVETTDMTIHWKALEVGALFDGTTWFLDSFFGENAFSEFVNAMFERQPIADLNVRRRSDGRVG
jgi:hypothetical protein